MRVEELDAVALDDSINDSDSKCMIYLLSKYLQILAENVVANTYNYSSFRKASQTERYLLRNGIMRSRQFVSTTTCLICRLHLWAIWRTHMFVRPSL